MKTDVNEDLAVIFDCQLKFLGYIDLCFFHHFF